MSLASLISQRRIIVCVGSGGVGKTTTAAAFALAAARAGRRTLVLTIDPAKRLANSLGLPRLDHEVRRVPDEVVAEGGTLGGGALFAMMLDQKRTFDELADRWIPDPGARERVRRNRIYQQISTTLTGSHEYAAMAKLCGLAEERHYDLIVLDTPPTANALDFLDAPEKLVSAIDSPALQWFARLYMDHSTKVLGMGGAFVLKRLAKFVGSQFLEDIGQFVGENVSLLQGFRSRAHEMQDLLRRPEAAFVLVCSAERASVEESIFFHGRLKQQALPFGGFVVNRVHPKGPPAPARGELVDRLAARSELRGYGEDDLVQVAADLDRTYRDFQALADLDAKEVSQLEAVAPGAALVQVPLLDRDVHDVEGLGLIGAYLFAASAAAA